MRRFLSTIFLSLSLLTVSACSADHLPASTEPLNLQKPDVQHFINQLVEKDHMDRAQVTAWLKAAQIQPNIVKTIQKPAESKSWAVYRQPFLSPARVSGGVEFWQKNAEALKQVQDKYQVSPAILVATLGVETSYGKIQGNYRVLDSLSTLSFYYPSRAKFFQSELRELFLLGQDHQLNPFTLRGSYAGAFGQIQFMPSSYHKYAVAENPNAGPADISGRTEDAIASVAHYYQGKGWRAGEAIAVRATVAGTAYRQAPTNRLRPNSTVGELKKYGITPQTALADETPVTFLVLAGENGEEYWLGLHNFGVISAYNPRINYVMAVYQLSEKIQLAHDAPL